MSRYELNFEDCLILMIDYFRVKLHFNKMRSELNSNVDKYLEDGCMRCKYGGTPDCKVHTWIDVLKSLRSIVLDCGLHEEIKWGVPCYTHKGKNILIVSAFKDYASIGFMKGALLKDSHNLLEKPGESSQHGRYIPFTKVSQVKVQEEIIRLYIFEAIDNEDKGLKIITEKMPEAIPDEFQEFLDNNPSLASSFYALTPGRQRGYIIYFSGAKQSKTRISRIEKYIPKILSGLGFHDR